MSKAVIGLSALGIGATTAVAAPLAVTLSGGTRGGVEEESFDPTPSVAISSWKGLMPTLNSAQDIQKSYQDINCLKNKLQSIQSWNGSTSSEDDEDLNFNPNDTEGCLVVDYYKQKYEGDKWKGKFKLVWSTVGSGNNERGFITVVHAETKNGQLEIDSAFYKLSKSGGIWKVNYGDKSNKTTSDNSDLSKRIPQPGNAIEGYKDKASQYWGFEPELSKICKGGECVKGEGTPTEFSSAWTISYGSNRETDVNTDIFANFDEWFKGSFKNGEELTIPISASLINPKLTKQSTSS